MTRRAADPAGSPPSEDLETLLATVDEDMRRLIRELAEARFADTESRRERTAAERKWLLGLIDVVDAFDRVLGNIESKPDRITEQMRIWIGNFKAVRKVVARQLADAGAVPLAPEVTFDPGRHTIVDTVVDGDRPDGTIVSVLKPGYERGGEVVRKAEVQVVRSDV